MSKFKRHSRSFRSNCLHRHHIPDRAKNEMDMKSVASIAWTNPEGRQLSFEEPTLLALILGANFFLRNVGSKNKGGIAHACSSGFCLR